MGCYSQLSEAVDGLDRRGELKKVFRAGGRFGELTLGAAEVLSVRFVKFFGEQPIRTSTLSYEPELFPARAAVIIV